MEKTEITLKQSMAGSRQYAKVEPASKKERQALPWGDVARIALLWGLGFLWGRMELLQLLHPMGMAYLSMFFGEGILFWAIFSSVAMATFATSPLKAGAALAAALAVQLTLGRFVEREERLKKALLGAFSMALAGVFFALSQGGSHFYFAIGAVETALVLGLSLFGQQAVFFLWEKRRIPAPTREEAAGLTLVIGIGLTGLQGLPIAFFSQFLLAFFLSFFILLSVWKEGIGGGAAAGVLIGFLFYVTGIGNATLLATLALSGLLAGAVRDAGRAVSGLVQLATPIVFFFYAGGVAPTSLLAGGWLMGVLCYTIMPKNLLFRLIGGRQEMVAAKDVYTKKCEAVEEKLARFSKAFTSLADVFVQQKDESGRQDVSLLMDRIAEESCNGCGMAHYCWEEELYQTYSILFSALSHCESKGRATVAQFPEGFQKTCVRKDLLLEQVNKAYDGYRRDQIWKGQLDECRDLVGQQMRSVSEILLELSGQMKIGEIFLEQQARLIREECTKKGIRLREIQVTQEKNGHGRAVKLTMRSCGGKAVCKEGILPAVRKVLGTPMVLQDAQTCQCGADGICRLSILEAPSFALTTAVAFRSAEEGDVCGDASACMETEDGTSLMALSDGMGHGASAAEESRTAIELLEQFTQAGFQRELAIRMINSALLLRKGDESYATLDICAVDLFDGRAEFVKLGAVSSFISREGRIFSITSNTLPAGIMKQVTVERNDMLLKDGDMVILMTDGVTDALGGEIFAAGWLKDKLSENAFSNPQDVAEFLLNEASAVCKEDKRDDMTVLAGRFWKRRKGA